MDMKVHGLPVSVLKQALEQGRDGRAHILEHMLTTLAQPRAEMSPYAPRVESIQINPDKIREIIGKVARRYRRLPQKPGQKLTLKTMAQS